ncbi:MAG: SpvB/TcaC N-terminal domain-containing protein, partial [Myxococcota bacterium]
MGWFALASAAVVGGAVGAASTAFAQDEAWVVEGADLRAEDAFEHAASEGLELEEELREELGEALAEEVLESLDEPIDDPELPEDRETIALPDGVERSAVMPQAVSLPQGEGSIEGMGESFTPQLSAGTGTYAVPIALPPGRAGVAPSLGLSYSTGGGNGPVGIGWNLSMPFIARQTDRGLPRYQDADAWHREEDRFIYNGGAELVPVAEDPDGAPIPAELTGWQQYRARIESGFLRFFRDPSGRRWVVQAPSGTRFDFGLLPVGEADFPTVNESRFAVQSEDDEGSGPAFRWWLTRMSDPHGSTVYYRYRAHEGQRYVDSIFYLSPASCAAPSVSERRRCSAPMSDYGRRVRFVYEDRADAFASYVSTWRIQTALRLRRVEITAATGGPGERFLVRRVHLAYDPASFHSLLQQVQIEGRPEAMDASTASPIGLTDVPEDALTDALVGATLPPMTFGYSEIPATTDSIAGFGGLHGLAEDVAVSPPHSVDEARADLFDVNSDGLPDLLVSDPARYRDAEGRPAAGVFFNGFDGSGASPGQAGSFSDPVSVAVPAGLSHVMSFANQNIAPMDVDGDGRSDFLHMPRVAAYGYFAITRNGADDAVSPAAQDWGFVHVPVALPPGTTDPRIDLGRDGSRIKTVDVNNDHLIDVVRTNGSAMQTWLNLGWLPGGDGRFGSAYFDGEAWVLSTEPTTSCLLHAGRPLDFADAGTQFADMNGDGIQDVVAMRRGRVVYWPGRGLGHWGVRGRCSEGESGAERHVEMRDAPETIHPDLRQVRLTDVNADGAADIVQVRFDAIDVYFNRAGEGFAERLILRNTPAAPDHLSRVRFADLDGSGTPDIIFGNAHRWQFIDLHGGVRPRLLTRVDNGLGATTRLEYGASTEDYLRDLAAPFVPGCTLPGCETFSWSHVRGACDARLEERAGVCAYRSGSSPVVSTVVRATESTDNLDRLGREATIVRSEYRYHDAYYEGIEQENRGFGAADAIAVGDTTHPTAISRTYFHQGRRPNEIASERLADNPNEALKAQPWLAESWDAASGAVLGTDHTSVTLRELGVGLDGRHRVYAYAHQSDSFSYDHAPFEENGESVVLPRIRREGLGGEDAALESETVVTVRGQRWSQIRSVTSDVSDQGHVRVATALGRMRGEYGEEAGVDEAITSHARFVRLNDESGWRWASTESWIEGEDGVPLGHTESEFDPLTGDMRISRGDASAPTTFEFLGDGDAEGFVQGDQLLVASSRFDAWGQALAICAGGDLALGDGECLRYAEVDFDAEWSAFPTEERIAVRREGGAFSFLTLSAHYDRALGVATGGIDANGYEAEVGYDGLGRVRYQRA